MNRTYKIVLNINDPQRNGETKEFYFPFESAHNINEHFKQVIEWANGAVIIEI